MSLVLIIILTTLVLAILIIAGLAVVNFSSDEMYEKFKKASTVPTSISPIELADIVSKKHFYNNIMVVLKPNKFCDCYSSNNILTLCSDYANERQLAGLAICAHELGHAFQFANEKEKMKKYGAELKTSKIISKFIAPLILASAVLVVFNKIIFGLSVFALACVLFVVALSVKMSTIKIEKQASDTAIKILEHYANLTESEISQAKMFLNSAKQTYVADMLKYMLKWTGLTKK